MKEQLKDRSFGAPWEIHCPNGHVYTERFKLGVPLTDFTTALKRADICPQHALGEEKEVG